jgi:hydrogenase maturation protein HypF
VARDITAGVSAGIVSARFHRSLADATARACTEIAARHGLDLAVLSGGVFQNRALLEATAGVLEARGLRVLLPERVPPNDGGIALGQAAIVGGIASLR